MKKKIFPKYPRATLAVLTTNQRNIARIAGFGNLSKGIRVALEHWLETHPDVKREYRAGKLAHLTEPR